jgi:hypothetical protein
MLEVKRRLYPDGERLDSRRAEPCIFDGDVSRTRTSLRTLVLSACVCTALLLTSASGWKLALNLGLVYDQQGVANVVKAASDPSSSS